MGGTPSSSRRASATPTSRPTSRSGRDNSRHHRRGGAALRGRPAFRPRLECERTGARHRMDADGQELLDGHGGEGRLVRQQLPVAGTGLREVRVAGRMDDDEPIPAPRAARGVGASIAPAGGRVRSGAGSRRPGECSKRTSHTVPGTSGHQVRTARSASRKSAARSPNRWKHIVVDDGRSAHSRCASSIWCGNRPCPFATFRSPTATPWGSTSRHPARTATSPSASTSLALPLVGSAPSLTAHDLPKRAGSSGTSCLGRR